MTIRLATGSDAAAVAALAAATFPLACPPSTTEEQQRAFIASALSEESFASYLTDPARVLLVDDADGHLTGYSMLVLGDPTDPDVRPAVRIRPSAEVSKIYVLADQHGRGVAAALLGRTLAVATEHGAAGAWLGTNRQNARALRFYAKHGFTVVGSRRFRVGDSLEDDVVLERPFLLIRGSGETAGIRAAQERSTACPARAPDRGGFS